MLKQIPNFFSEHKAFVIFLCISIFVRCVNISEALYFTWDNGRDYFAVQKIVSGDITLIGPTTGLQGFYLGPLWYYLGLPGFIVGKGSPYVFLLGYIAIGQISLPLFWMMAHELFKDKHKALVLAYMLSLAPGSIWGTIRVWNPLLSIPLMAAVFLSLLRARESKRYLAVSFFLLGLVLQSEFAYGIFYVAVLFLLLPWIRKKSYWRDYLYAILPLALTLMPQILFELRHSYVMTKSLYTSMLAGDSTSWLQLLRERPLALLVATSELVVSRYGYFPILIAVLVLILSGMQAVSKIKAQDAYAWKLLVVMFCIPYVGFMIWKGNGGYFFSYYLTPHFLFILPFCVLGAEKLSHYFLQLELRKCTIIMPIVFILLIVFLIPWSKNVYGTTIRPENNSGFSVMEKAIFRLLSQISEDKHAQNPIRIYTANVQTEHYDAILLWQAKKLGINNFSTVKNGNETSWYLLIEPDWEWKEREQAWYAKETEGGVLVKSEKIGDLTFESWVASGSAHLE